METNWFQKFPETSIPPEIIGKPARGINVPAITRISSFTQVLLTEKSQNIHWFFEMLELHGYVTADSN